MPQEVEAPRRRWLLQLGITLVALIGLWAWIAQPWVPFQLWRDVTTHETEFRLVAEDALSTGAANSEALARLGYEKLRVDHRVVLFYRYSRFRGEGILGLAYLPDQAPAAVTEWAEFQATPPLWPWLQMPNRFYVFSGKSYSEEEDLRQPDGSRRSGAYIEQVSP